MSRKIFPCVIGLGYVGLPLAVEFSKSFNVSSLTDNGTGDTTINLTSSMDGVDYAASGSSSYTYAVLMFSDNGKAAGSVDAETRNVSDSIGDSNDNSVLIHGDLA